MLMRHFILFKVNLNQFKNHTLSSNFQLLVQAPTTFQKEIMSTLPSGPLDHYRKRASFDWKQMKSFFDSEEVQDFEVSTKYHIPCKCVNAFAASARNTNS